jgi:secondary thiamine-phosphate synthase enzyme
MIGRKRSFGGMTVNITQKTLEIAARSPGCHIITDQIVRALPELRDYSAGLLNVFLQHTSASITINENCCADVRSDLNGWMNRTVPEGKMWSHQSEGPDDMPAHVKSSVMGVSLNIPISEGRLALGTWQGIYLNEHRVHGGARKIILTITGQKK